MDSAPVHRCRLLGSPWPGLHATVISSARHYARHTHATYGFGVVDQGAQRSASDRGTVARQFARHYGYTPGAWQRALLQ